MNLWDTIEEWLRKPTGDKTETQRAIAERPEEAERLSGWQRLGLGLTPAQKAILAQSQKAAFEARRQKEEQNTQAFLETIKGLPEAAKKYGQEWLETQRQFTERPQWQTWLEQAVPPAALFTNPAAQKALTDIYKGWGEVASATLPPGEKRRSWAQPYEEWKEKTTFVNLPFGKKIGGEAVEWLTPDIIFPIGKGGQAVKLTPKLAKWATELFEKEGPKASQFIFEYLSKHIPKQDAVKFVEALGKKAAQKGVEAIPQAAKAVKPIVDDVLKLVDVDIKSRVMRYQGTIIHTWPRNLNYKEGIETLISRLNKTPVDDELLPLKKILTEKGIPGAVVKPTATAVEGVAKGGIVPPVKPPSVTATGEPWVEPAKSKLIRLIKSAKPVRKTQEAMYSAERGKRGITGAEILAKGEGKEAFQAAKAPLKGELPKPQFEPPEVGLVDTDITNLYNDIKNAVIKPLSEVDNFYAKVNASEGLTKLLAGITPQESELKLLEKVFGPELVQAILGKKTKWTLAKDIFLDLANLPRAFQTSFDFSAPLRQGVMLVSGHPLQGFKTMKPMFQSFYKEKYYTALNDALLQNKWAQQLMDWGLDITTIEKGAKRIAMEEPYISKYARYIPGIKQSERAYLAFLNKIRMDCASQILEKWSKAGVEITDDLGKQVATVINVMSGRGSLGKMTYTAPFLNTLMYSPRLQAARVQLPYYYIKALADPASRPLAKEMTRNIVSFIGGATTLVGLAATAGANVELDPRSSDFGKIRVRNTRIDPWAGFQQYARFLTQLVTGERKTTSAGAMVPANRYDVVLRFFESKMSPSASIARDILAGKTFAGEKLELTWESLGKQAKDRLVGLFVQDMWDAAEAEGLAGIGMALPGMFGVGIQTYPDTLADLEVQLGKSDKEGKTYTLSSFSGDMGRRGYIKGGITEGSDLVKFRGSSEELFDKYDALKDTKAREAYRQNNPQTDAALFFWGRTGTLKTDTAKRIVQGWVEKYEIPSTAIPGWESYQQTLTPTQQQVNRQNDLAVSSIESQVWSQYPPQLRSISDQIIRLENSDNRNDQIKARQLLMQYPQILMARRLIAQQKALYKRQQVLQGVR